MSKRTLSKGEMIELLKEVRDNTPEIYEDKDKIYYNILTEIIANLEV